MKRFRLITNSAEPKVIGTSNGISQIEFFDKDLEEHPDFAKLYRLFFFHKGQEIQEYNKELQELRVLPLKGELVAGAKITDLMGFSPYFFGSDYIISGRVVDILLDFRLDKSEITLLPVELYNEEGEYFLLSVPMVQHEEIIFEESLLYPSRQEISEKRDYFAISSFKEYKENLGRSIFMNFEKVVLPEQYEQKDIIKIQGIASLFFSDALIEACQNKGLTSFQVSNRKIELTFR